MYPINSVKKETQPLYFNYRSTKTPKSTAKDSKKTKGSGGYFASKKEKPKINSGVFSSSDIAEILGISIATARKLIEKEKLPTVPYTKNILVPIAAFNNWHMERFNVPVAHIAVD